MSSEPDGLDLIWGAEGIAKAIGCTKRKTYHMLEAGLLPARQIGQRWVVSRRKLQEHFEAELTS
ncbi:MAG TPA: helix-turn-helix domain-containing protein [Devosia sp.]|jgi:excisionase family DNA binding protein|nr:helix-turn-helix domain-containing protein [Devosia sp.]